MRKNKPAKKRKSKYNLIAIDFGITRPGICFTDRTKPEGFTCTSWNGPEKENFSHPTLRFDQCCDQLICSEIPYTISNVRTVIMMEDYAAGAKGRTNDIAECSGILKYKLLIEHGVYPDQLWLCHISHLKMFVTGKGNCKKELVLKEVYKRWRFDTDDNNEADAFVMWKILGAIYNHDPITDYQKGIIKRIRKFNK